jgi:site-specific recombinase XerD
MYHVTKRRNVWFARLAIPVDVRSVFDGRKIFIASTHERDIKNARAVAAVQVASWQKRIDEARANKPDPARSEIERLAAEYRTVKAIGSDEEKAVLISDVIRFTFERLGGLTADQRRQVLATSRGNVGDAMRSLPADARAAFDQIIGQKTSFLHHFEVWQSATHLKGKTLDQAVSDIKRFAAAHPDAMTDTITGGKVQKWIGSLLRPTAPAKALSPSTVKRVLSGIRSYWEWMQVSDHVAKDHKPFADRIIKGSKTKAEQREDERHRWEPHELVALWRAAEQKGDQVLANVTKIAAYTGARRGGICDLKASSVRTDHDTRIRFLHFVEKTEAGVRDVPIHPAIAGLIDELVAHADREGWLIPVKENKYNDRGDAIGKRFTRLKQELGYDERHVFHSIRHTVVHSFRKAGCDLEMRDKLMGHANRTVGAGYGGDLELKTAADWFERAIQYPD